MDGGGDRLAVTAQQKADTDVVFDPSTYALGVPFEALARLRRECPVV